MVGSLYLSPTLFGDVERLRPPPPAYTVCEWETPLGPSWRALRRMGGVRSGNWYWALEGNGGKQLVGVIQTLANGGGRGWLRKAVGGAGMY